MSEKMQETLRESLSALMDGEANELELQRLMGGIADNPELRGTWTRYHAVRSALGAQEFTGLSMDVSQRVRDALADSAPVALLDQSGGRMQRFFKPMASFAVAASVAAVVVVGGQQISQIGDAGSYSSGNTVAAGASPVGLINSLGAVPLQASYGTQRRPDLQPAARTAYRELARQRMEKYMQQHAEHAALNSPQGLVPFARVREIKE
ncbi:MAG: sigma-E factor negative regulatory protein [Halioglobus sp.]